MKIKNETTSTIFLFFVFFLVVGQVVRAVPIHLPKIVENIIVIIIPLLLALFYLGVVLIERYNANPHILGLSSVLICFVVLFLIFPPKGDKRHFKLDLLQDSCRRDQLIFDGYLSSKGEFFIITTDTSASEIRINEKHVGRIEVSDVKTKLTNGKREK